MEMFMVISGASEEGSTVKMRGFKCVYHVLFLTLGKDTPVYIIRLPYLSVFDTFHSHPHKTSSKRVILFLNPQIYEGP